MAFKASFHSRKDLKNRKKLFARLHLGDKKGFAKTTLDACVDGLELITLRKKSPELS